MARTAPTSCRPWTTSGGPVTCPARPGRTCYIGLACSWKGDWAEAGVHCEQALALFRQAGDRAGQRWALAGLGSCHAHLGNYDLARGYARQALEVAPEAGDPTDLALAWDALGLVHSRLGEHRQAISCYRQALALARERKNPLARRWLASLLASFGDACRAAGDLPAAVEAWQQALQILHDLGLPDEPPDPRQARAGRPAQPAGLIITLPPPAVSRLAPRADGRRAGAVAAGRVVCDRRPARWLRAGRPGTGGLFRRGVWRDVRRRGRGTGPTVRGGCQRRRPRRARDSAPGGGTRPGAMQDTVSP